MVVVWLAVVSSADGLNTVALWRGCRRASVSAWGPFWPPVATSPPAAAAAAWRGQGRVPIAGWSLGGVGPDWGLRGGRRRVWCVEWSGPGEARTILLFHIISARPSKQPRMVLTFLKVHMELGACFLTARTNKRHHHPKF